MAVRHGLTYLRLAVDPDSDWGSMAWIDLATGELLNTYDPTGSAE
ncbi:hypothetical protein [Actinopolyspora mortivallis]|nr:hypothetical protein [Actinopolyspora mortivallis]